MNQKMYSAAVLDTLMYLVEYGPMSADDIVNNNEDQARRFGASPSLSWHDVQDALAFLERATFVATDGAIWFATARGQSFDRRVSRS